MVGVASEIYGRESRFNVGEWNTMAFDRQLAYRRGEVDHVCMATLWCGDDTPVFRIVDNTLDEVAGGIGKQCGNVRRLLNLAEWCAVLGSLELGEIHQGTEMVQNCPRRQITKRDIPTLQPRPRGRNIPFVHACYLTAPCHC